MFVVWRGCTLKLLSQIAVLFGVCFVSQLIEWALPFAFPASIIGMVVLFLLLLLRVLKVERIREVSDFLLSNMALFFIPASVSIINYFDLLRENLVPLLVICTVSTVLTFTVTALTVRLTRRLLRGREKK